MNRFFRFEFDTKIENPAIFDIPRNESGDAFDWDFVFAKEWSKQETLNIRFCSVGVVQDVNFGLNNIIYVKPRIKDLLYQKFRSDVQFVSVYLDGDEYFIMNVLKLLDCLDEEYSEFTLWDKNSGRRDLVGEYRYVNHIALERESVTGFNAFRIKRYSMCVIVSQEFRRSIVEIGASGSLFSEVGVV